MNLGLPTITILTVVRNRSQLLAETIDCIQAQTITEWEYIIVDDASEDETPQTIRNEMETDKRIIGVWRKQQGGPFLAANDGLKIAKGEYVVNIDSDDLSPPDRIEKQLAFMKLHPELRACITPWWSFDRRGLIPGAKVQLPTSTQVLRWVLMLRGFVSHSSLCIERKALLEVGNYRPLPTAGDYALMCTLSQKGWLGVLPEILSYVRHHPGRMSKTIGIELGPVIGNELLSEHIFKVTGIQPKQNLVEAFRSLGESRKIPVSEGLEALKTWQSWWQTDPKLNQADYQELERFSVVCTWLFLYNHLRDQPDASIKTMGNLFFLSPSSVSNAAIQFLLQRLVNRLGNYLPRRQPYVGKPTRNHHSS